MSNLKLELRVGESVEFDGGRVVITLLDKTGQRARLDIKAGDDVKVKTNKSNISSLLAKDGINKNYFDKE